MTALLGVGIVVAFACVSEHTPAEGKGEGRKLVIAHFCYRQMWVSQQLPNRRQKYLRSTRCDSRRELCWCAAFGKNKPLTSTFSASFWFRCGCNTTFRTFSRHHLEWLFARGVDNSCSCSNEQQGRQVNHSHTFVGNWNDQTTSTNFYYIIDIIDVLRRKQRRRRAGRARF